MDLISISILCLVTHIASAVKSCPQRDYVNTFIGSGGMAYGYGAVNPGAHYPLGSLRLGPDTTNTIVDIGYRHFSGYHFQDTKIRAFSHTHVVGAGVDDLGNIGIMPISTMKKSEERKFERDSWWSTFNKSTEVSSPGMYSVYLDDPKVQVDLLSIGTLAAVHRYSWSGSSALRKSLVVDLCHVGKLEVRDQPCANATLEISSSESNKFKGSAYIRGGLSGTMWFYVYGEIVPSVGLHSDVKWKTCVGDLSCEAASTTTTSTSGTLFGVASFLSEEIGGRDLSVQVRVGLSYISTEVAEKNLKDALSGPVDEFSALQQRTSDDWCDVLSKLSIEALDSDPDILPILHSAHYRSMISVADFTESGDIYLGVDKQVHNAKEERSALYESKALGNKKSMQYRFFSDLSLWDTFRTWHPWMLLIDEDLSVGIARSMGEITVQQKAFPRWVMASHEASCMVGESGTAFILEAVMCGFSNEFDLVNIQKYFLQQSVEKVSLNGRADVEHYIAEGYVSQDAADKATTLTLNYAFDDFILAKLSEAVNDTKSSSEAMIRSKNYQKIWSPEMQIFCPKYASGELKCPKSPVGPEAWSTFTEGDALHYAFFVTHDAEGLVALYPSPEAFDKSLESFLVSHVPFQEALGSPVPNPYYWAGNEHDFFSPFMFNFGPDCTKTQYWARQLTKLHFSNTPHGVPGNEDYGAMATWVMFASLGLFPQAGLNRFLISSPRVKSATISLKRWNALPTQLEIVTYNNSDVNVFVQKLLLNGVEVKNHYLNREEIVRDGGVKLEFYMQAEQSSGICAK